MQAPLNFRRYRRFLHYPLYEWRTLVWIVPLTLLASLSAVLQPWPVKLLVDYAFNPTALPEWAQDWFAGSASLFLVVLAASSSFGLYVLGAVLDMALGLLWASTGQRMTYRLAAHLFWRLQQLSPSFHRRYPVGDSLARLSSDVYCVYSFTQLALVAPARHLLTLFCIGLVAWTLSPALTLFTLAMVPLLLVITRLYGLRIKQQAIEYSQAQSRLTSFTQQTLSAIPLVQAFAAQSLNLQQYRHLAEGSVQSAQRRELFEQTHTLLSGSVAVLSTALVLWLGGQQVLSGTLSLGSLLVLLGYLGTIQSAYKGLLKNYVSWKSLQANMDRVLEVMDSPDRVKEALNAQPLRAKVQGAIRFEGISFGYEARREILKDLNLEVGAGEKVAIVGSSGAGKSTLVSLMLRFFDPWQGRVLLDGVDIRQLQLKSLRSNIATVLQEPFLLPISIAENIAYGRPEASRAEVIEAAKAANAQGFIEKLADGYDTVIGERGATLSGGEKQRIAIARALLKDAPILILDEPTSALDGQTEAGLLEALERLMKGRTTLIIAHRLSTIKKADRIVVLEGGRVVEVGSHLELLSSKGQYHWLYATQIGEP